MFIRNHDLRLALILGSQDIKQAYRRSAIGSFWITAGMSVQILSMGVVFGLIFKTETELYVPFLATSIIIWGFISGTITEACMAFINAEGIIKQVSLPYAVYVIRVIWKNVINLGHNILLLPIVFLIFSSEVNWAIILFIPGFLVLVINLGWIAFILAAWSARFRDMPPIITSLLTVAFYVTPVMWSPNLLPGGTAHLLLGLNPFYHLIQIVRLPLLGQVPTMENWTLSCLLAIIGLVAARAISKKYASQIAYWV